MPDGELKAPQNVYAVRGEGTAVLVYWERPDSASSPTTLRRGAAAAGGSRGVIVLSYSFRVYRRRKATPADHGFFDWKLVLEDKYALECLCPDLSPDTEYEFFVQSHGVAGDGPPSAIVTCRTNPGPPVAPRDLRCVTATLDEVGWLWRRWIEAAAPPKSSNLRSRLRWPGTPPASAGPWTGTCCATTRRAATSL